MEPNNDWQVSIEAEGFVAMQGDKRVVVPSYDFDELIAELRKFDEQEETHPRRDAVVHVDPIPPTGAEAKL